MTEEQPHPQRCHNNCNNLTKKGSCLVATRKLSHVAKPHQFDNGEGLYITQSERDLIAIIGCAAYTNNDPTQMHIVTSCPLNDNCGDCNKQPYFVCSELVKQKKDAECSSCIYKRFAANMRNAKAHDAAIRKDERKKVLTHLLDNFDTLDTYGEEQGVPLVSLLDVQNRVDTLRGERP